MIIDMTTLQTRTDGTIIGAWANDHYIHYNGKQIYEDFALSRRIMAANFRTPDADLREMFPYKCRLIKDCSITGKPSGHIFDYARTKTLPEAYPIMVLYFDGSETRWGNFNCGEAELLIPKGTPLVILAK